MSVADPAVHALDPLPAAGAHPARVSDTVDRELLQAAITRGRRSSLGLAFGWLTIAAVASSEAAYAAALGMLAFTAVVLVWRLLLWPKHASDLATRVAATRRSFVASMAVSGLGWAFALLCIFPIGSVATQLLIGLMFCGSLTLGAQYLVLVRWALFVHTAPQTLAAMAVLALYVQASEPLLLAMALFVVMLVGSARHHLRMNVRNIRDRLSLAQANEALREARDHADAANAAKSRFLAAMSHEIRTPMNGLLGALQMVERTPLDARQQEWLQVASRSGDALLGVVNQVLDYSRIEAGERPRPADDSVALQPFVNETIGLFRAAAEARKIALVGEVAAQLPSQVCTDAQRLRQVLSNLLGNALKFTDGGSVRLAVGHGPLGLRFAVHDTGCGVPREAQPRLFEPFFQADQSDRRRHGGTGLGLSICRQLVSALGGRISFVSTPGVGSVFSVDLPLRPAGTADTPAPAAAQQAAVERPDFSAYRCLLAEDNPVNRMLALEMLRATGLQVCEAADGIEALRLAEREAFDLILMDCQMPVLDGFAATAAIRASERRRGAAPVPIVALTANALHGDAERCLAAGMNDHLAKPYRREELEARLARWLHQRPADSRAAA